MSLEVGQSLLHYRLMEQIGAGGMGVVWKASDTVLDREVAIKILPPVFATSPERLIRFEREARLLASLNHPHIAAVYGLHEAEGQRFLAMELVPGEDLASVLSRGALPVGEAVAVARQIAEALEAAHESGVVHRDLKPANVVLRPDGEIKVLDFGLAKALGPEGAADGDPSHSPTMTSAGSFAGVILGTAAYMSPEQARGRPVDRRADIWALGCVLYEMLTGRRLFEGETVSDTLAAVLRGSVDLDNLPAATPPGVRRLLARCLDRDPRMRLRDAGEARIALGEQTVEAGPARVETRPSARSRARWIVAAALPALVAGAALGRYALAPTAVERDQRFAFDVTVAEGKIEPGSLALSPDGSHLAFLVRGEGGTVELWLRPLGSFEARAVPETRGASYPFWSPDGREIGFFAGDELMRVALDGTSPRRVAAAPGGLGGTWNADGVILFGREGGPIQRVDAAGGALPTPVTRVDAPAEDAHAWPVFLPDGKHFVFLADASTDEGHRAYLADLDGGAGKILLKGIRSSLAFDPPSTLLFVQGQQLVAHALDLGRGELGAKSVLVADQVHPLGIHHHGPFSVSANGVLAVQHGTDLGHLVRYDLSDALRAGRPLQRDGSVPVVAPAVLSGAARYGSLVVSPDGRRVAYEMVETPDERMIWVHDIERNVRTAVSPRGTYSDCAAWSPDGNAVYFDSRASGKWEVYRGPADGGSAPERLGTPVEQDVAVLDCSADGRWLLISGNRGGGNWDLYLLPLDSTGAAWIPWLVSPAVEGPAAFSPDSRWIVYASDASGRSEVYVSPVEGGEAARRWQISGDGGLEPRFGPDGQRIFYRSPAGWLMSAVVRLSEKEIVAGVPETVLDLSTTTNDFVRNTFDLTPDGRGLVAIQPIEQGHRAIRLRSGWRPAG